MSATAFRSRTTPRHAWSLTAARVKHRLAVTSLVWTVSPCVLALMVAQNTRVKLKTVAQAHHAVDERAKDPVTTMHARQEIHTQPHWRLLVVFAALC